MSKRTLILAAMVSLAAPSFATAPDTAPSATGIALPDYAQDQDPRTLLETPIDICAAALRARLNHGDETFLARFAGAAHLTPPEARRLAEVCLIFNLGAATLVALAREHEASQGQVQQVPRVVPTI
jgi:hypothetical protein